MLTINKAYLEVPVDDLEPHPSNFNRGDLASIGESVDVNGFYGAMIVRVHPEYHASAGKYQILAGEHRWKTAKDRGAETVPCIVVDADDDVHAARILVGDNETAKRSSYDPAMLTETLAFIGSLEGTGFDLAALGDFEQERQAAEPVDEGDGQEFAREYGVVVIVEDEAAQRELYEELRERGLSVRVASI